MRRITIELLKIAKELSEYERKRDLEKSPEPSPEEKVKLPENAFVIQEHWAKKAGHHFDLRLRDGNVLKSWAIPKAKLPEPGEKLLAIQTEDHPLAYYNFEGVIPEGYGAGKVKIYCKGTYDTIKKTRTSWKFELHSRKCKGVYTLVKLEDNKWLIIGSKS